MKDFPFCLMSNQQVHRNLGVLWYLESIRIHKEWRSAPRPFRFDDQIATTGRPLFSIAWTNTHGLALQTV